MGYHAWSMSYSPDSMLLALGGQDEKVHIYNAQNFTELTNFQGGDQGGFV